MARNGTENGTLTGKQEAAALALAAGRTIGQAARAAGCGERSVKRWLHDRPAFAGRITALRAELVSRAVGRLTKGMASAAVTLRKLLSARSEQVRLGAARAVLELGNKLSESVELQAQIDALRTKLDAARESRSKGGPREA